jgi:hypothetical protein
MTHCFFNVRQSQALMDNYPSRTYYDFAMVIAVLCVLLTIVTDVYFQTKVYAQVPAASNTSRTEKSQNAQSLMESFMSPKSFMTSVIDQMKNSTSKNETDMHSRGTAVIDSTTVLLSHQIVPPKDFIHIYDSYPYKILGAHISAKLPCDENARSVTQIYAGNIALLKPTPVSLISELSRPGYMCLYQINITNGTIGKDMTDNTTRTPITDIVLYNPTDHREVLLNTSTIVITVNEISLAKDRSTQASKQ